MDQTQQDRLSRIMETQTAAATPEAIVPDPPIGTTVESSTSQAMVAKKSSSTPIFIIIGVVFFIIYALVWAYIFKLIKF